MDQLKKMGREGEKVITKTEGSGGQGEQTPCPSRPARWRARPTSWPQSWAGQPLRVIAFAHQAPNSLPIWIKVSEMSETTSPS